MDHSHERSSLRLRNFAAGLRAEPEVVEAAAKLRVIGRGFVYGELYDLDGYPGAVPDSNSKNRIAGMVLELPSDESILRQLDEYEGYDPEAPETSEFVRVWQTVELAGGGTLEYRWLALH